jgi:hypothetical protein
MKAQQDEGGGKILLGDNTGGEVVMLQPVPVRWSVDFNWTPLYIHIWVYSTLACAKFKLCQTFQNITIA